MKIRFILTVISFFVFTFSRSQSLGIGPTPPNASAKLEITSTNSDLLPARMTTAQRYSIVNPFPGLMIFNTTTQSIEIYAQYGWSKLKTEIPGASKLIGGNGIEQPKKIRNISDGGYMVIGSAGSSANGDFIYTDHGSTDY